MSDSLESDEGFDEREEQLSNLYGLLIIDGLDVRRMNQWTAGKMLDLLEDRQQDGLRTIITSSNPPGDWKLDESLREFMVAYYAEMSLHQP